ncbi:MAG TPA: aspartate kinase, partial [Elusimicrobiota bacterium]|nr:aspartate kinase [Elusimicrobiota bacterium]
MKFGGSSVRGAEPIRRVIEIVRGRLARKPVVVVSAMRGTTDALIALGQDLARGSAYRLGAIRQEHLKAVADLGLEPRIVERELAELEALAKGVAMVRELSPRSWDAMVSFGERLSARIIAAAFAKAGIAARAHDAFDAGMLTDDRFGAARPLPEADAAIRKALGKPKELAVVTGYIGKTKGGEVTTLGRNGSDYTATILGAALGAEEVEIWTDVDGVMTADPALVGGARSLKRLSFAEASELAYYGGRVLHPATLLPAVRKGIPIRVLNTFRPGAPGTVILA